MTEPKGPDGSPEAQRLASGSEQTPASSLTLWIAFAAHLLVLIIAVTASPPPSTAIVAAIACSIIAIAALTELAPAERPGRRAVTALIGGHGVATALLLAGLAPSVSAPLPLVGLAAAAALGGASLVAIRHASSMTREPRPLIVAPRVAAIAVVAQALLQRWVDSATSLSMPPRAPTYLSIAALGVALLASLSIIALRVRPRWPLAGLLAWTVGWVAMAADLSALIRWSFGGPFPTASHQLRQLDAELLQILATVGGLVIAAALVRSIRDVRYRHSAVVLLVGYAVFGVLAAVAEHRIAIATDFPTITTLRSDRDLAATLTAVALAAMLWLYWRRVVAPTASATPRSPR